MTSIVPVTDGHLLRNVLQEWAIRRVQGEMPGYFANARTVVLGGGNHDRTARTLRQYTDNIEFAEAPADVLPGYWPLPTPEYSFDEHAPT